MTWLTWRQFRVQALTVFTALAAVAVLLAITGPDLVGRTNFSDQNLLYITTIVLVYMLPAVVGAFWGVPMVTRELETGTHSLVWNQTATRTRWLATKLAVALPAAMLAAGVLSLAVTWWASPIDAIASQRSDTPMAPWIAPPVFAARAIAPVGYAAFAFVLGVAVGIVIRRTVAAMAVTLVVFVAVMFVVPAFVRPHVLPSVDERVTITDSNINQISGEAGVIQLLTVTPPAGAWVLVNETVDAGGSTISPLPDAVQDCIPDRTEGGPPSRAELSQCFTQLDGLGYKQRLVYQTADRFWPLQWIELALFLGMAALLTGFCFRRLRHLS